MRYLEVGLTKRAWKMCACLLAWTMGERERERTILFSYTGCGYDQMKKKKKKKKGNNALILLLFLELQSAIASRCLTLAFLLSSGFNQVCSGKKASSKLACIIYADKEFSPSPLPSFPPFLCLLRLLYLSPSTKQKRMDE